MPSCSFYQPTLNQTFYVRSKNHDVAQTSSQRIGGCSSVAAVRWTFSHCSINRCFDDFPGREVRYHVQVAELAPKNLHEANSYRDIILLDLCSPGTDSLEYSLVDRPQARQLARQDYSVFSQDYSVFSLDRSESSRTAAAAQAPGDTSHKKNPDDKIKSFNSKVLGGGWNIYSAW